jgi:hypothetical protein
MRIEDEELDFGESIMMRDEDFQVIEEEPEDLTIELVINKYSEFKE